MSQNNKNSLKRVYINPVVGDQVTFLKTSAETNGECTLVEVILAPNAIGVPHHYHKKYTETFHVLEGELSMRVRKKVRVLKAGESIAVEAFVPHSYSNRSGRPVRFTAEMRPGSPGFETSLKIAYGLARDGLVTSTAVPKKLSHLAIVSVLSEGNIAGLLSFLDPFLEWIAHQARKRGIEADLIKKYVD